VIVAIRCHLAAVLHLSLARQPAEVAAR
jgi:hypothetical protein